MSDLCCYARKNWGIEVIVILVGMQFYLKKPKPTKGCSVAAADDDDDDDDYGVILIT